MTSVINFKINFTFLIKPFFLHAQKVKTKIKISWERKDKIKSIFHHFWRAMTEANKKNFGRWESDFKVLGLDHPLYDLPRAIQLLRLISFHWLEIYMKRKDFLTSFWIISTERKMYLHNLHEVNYVIETVL